MFGIYLQVITEAVGMFWIGCIAQSSFRKLERRKTIKWNELWTLRLYCWWCLQQSDTLFPFVYYSFAEQQQPVLWFSIRIAALIRDKINRFVCYLTYYMYKSPHSRMHAIRAFRSDQRVFRARQRSVIKRSDIHLKTNRIHYY